jgi:Cu(I)/Ag(I) efflux system membrane fusion protein
VYRQESPGVFAGVLVELGPRLSGPGGVPYFPVLAGLEPGEQVVAAGSFLIDAETRLNPAAGSIYVSGGSGGKGGSPAAVRPSTPDDEEATVQANLGRLSAADRAAAEAQGTCPVLEGSRLGSMGPPVKLSLAGRTVFLCCQGCEKKALADPARTAARADELRLKKPPAPPPAAPASPAPEEEAEIRAELEKLPPADRALAEAQTFCPKTGERLGSMGVPQKLTVNGRAMFTCCRGCNAAVIANPEKALKRLEELKARPGGPKR